MKTNQIAAGATLCCAVLLVGACSGGTSASGKATADPTNNRAASNGGASDGGSGGGPAGGARGFPGATGMLAQIDGKTLQVQGTDTQTAVTYSASTTFSNTVAAKLSDVVTGVCVQARAARAVSGDSTPTSPSAPRTSSAPGDPVVAAMVEISPAVNGLCTAPGGFRAPGARPPGAGQQTGPAGAPRPDRTRGPGANGGNGFGGFAAFGKVTAVNAGGFTIESSRRAGSTGTTAAPKTQSVQAVRTATGTTYTRTGPSNAKALVLGRCVTALGKADDTGSIAATSIRLQPAQNGSCSTRFGGGPTGDAPRSPGASSGA